MKKIPINTLLVAAALTLVTACGGSEEPTTKDAVSADTEQVDVPTQDEADKVAADEINEENADAKLDELMKDIDG
jgi:ABC-type glycerol-3-phosphate transport system substrate-binding protein